MRKRSVISFLLCFLLALPPLSACTERESTWDRIQSSGTLRVGLDPTFPPFESFDGATLQGLDVDLARAIAADKALIVDFRQFGYDGLYDALATEQVDVLISALTPEPSRTKDFAYSDGYVNSGLVLVSLATSPYGDVASLRGRRVAVELGAVGHLQATTWQRQVQDLAISTFNSSDDALRALAGGGAEAAVVDNITYLLFDRSTIGNVFGAVQLTNEPYAVVVRSEDDELLTQMNDALTTLRSNGRLGTILESWLPG